MYVQYGIVARIDRMGDLYNRAMLAVSALGRRLYAIGHAPGTIEDAIDTVMGRWALWCNAQPAMMEWSDAVAIYDNLPEAQSALPRFRNGGITCKIQARIVTDEQAA